MKGIVASSAALSLLLAEGIGDTIRVSLTPRPGGDRTEEVLVAQQILQSLGLRSFTPQVTACPGCGRTTSTYFQKLAEDIQTYLREQMPVWRESHPGVEEMKVAVMGCVVNGPGRASMPTSASRCRERSRSPRRQCTWTGAAQDAQGRQDRRGVSRDPQRLRAAYVPGELRTRRRRRARRHEDHGTGSDQRLYLSAIAVLFSIHAPARGATICQRNYIGIISFNHAPARGATHFIKRLHYTFRFQPRSRAGSD